MAQRKSRSKAKETEAPPAGGRLDSLFESLRDATEKEFGKDGVSSCSEFFDSIEGIPLDENLPLQFLVGIDVIPLHRVFHLVGEPASFKSTMAWYFAYKFLKNQGLVAWLDTEHKSNPDMVKAFLQGDTEGFSKRVLVHELRSMDHTLKAMQRHAAWYDDSIPNKDVPFMLLLDSLGAVTSEESIDQMNKAGKAVDGPSFVHAHRAAELTEQFRAYVPTHLASKPMFLLCTNHLKKEIGTNMPGMPPKDRTGGGVGKDFASTCTIKMAAAKDMSTSKETKKLLTMKTMKASLAPTGRKINVIMTLKRDEETGHEMAFFDWDTALCELLIDDKQVSKTARNEIVQVTQVNKSKYNCTTLGLSGVHPRELGAALHANKEIREKLQDLLGIHRKRRFNAG
jgi:RecA/RadA recombinase